MKRLDRQTQEEISARMTALGTIGNVLDVLRRYDMHDAAIEWLEQDVTRQRAACVESLRGRLRAVEQLPGLDSNQQPSG